jgi:hypothetical protein
MSCCAYLARLRGGSKLKGFSAFRIRPEVSREMEFHATRSHATRHARGGPLEELLLAAARLLTAAPPLLLLLTAVRLLRLLEVRSGGVARTMRPPGVMTCTRAPR